MVYCRYITEEENGEPSFYSLHVVSACYFHCRSTAVHNVWSGSDLSGHTIKRRDMGCFGLCLVSGNISISMAELAVLWQLLQLAATMFIFFPIGMANVLIFYSSGKIPRVPINNLAFHVIEIIDYPERERKCTSYIFPMSRTGVRCWKNTFCTRVLFFMWFTTT